MGKIKKKKREKTKPKQTNKQKTTTLPNACKDAEKPDRSYIVGGKGKLYTCPGKLMAISYRIRQVFTV